jgi:dihydrofolate reductase
MRPEIILIAACGQNRVIGNQGQLPWHIPEDLKRFKRLTVGKPVIMGRKTYESIGKPLVGRHNIVITRQTGYRAAPEVSVVRSFAEAVAAAGLEPQTRAEEIFIIGGAEIYVQSLAFATSIELTLVHQAPDGDAFFPPLDPNIWHVVQREAHTGFDFITYARNPAND